MAIADSGHELPENPHAIEPEPELTPPHPPAPQEPTPLRPAKRAHLDYWIAGVTVVLVIAGFGGREVVRRLSASAPPGVATNPEDARVAAGHIDTGMSYYNGSNYTAAEAEFRKAIRSDPGSARAYNDLGAALNNQKRWDEAIAALGEAIKLDPALDIAKNNLSYSYSQKALASQLRINPGAAEGASKYIAAGMAFYTSSNYALAEEQFRKAVQADPDSALAYNDLGAALDNQKRWDEAIGALQKAVALNPALDLAKNNLAYAVAHKAHGGNGRE